MYIQIRSDDCSFATTRKGILHAHLAAIVAVVDVGGSALSESLRDTRIEVTLSLTDILLGDSSNLHHSTQFLKGPIRFYLFGPPSDTERNTTFRAETRLASPRLHATRKGLSSTL
jgi:hypothetical protein